MLPSPKSQFQETAAVLKSVKEVENGIQPTLSLTEKFIKSKLILDLLLVICHPFISVIVNLTGPDGG